jgi:hypothetical protein
MALPALINIQARMLEDALLIIHVSIVGIATLLTLEIENV